MGLRPKVRGEEGVGLRQSSKRGLHKPSSRSYPVWSLFHHRLQKNCRSTFKKAQEKASRRGGNTTKPHLDEVPHGSGGPTGLGVDVLHSSVLQQLLRHRASHDSRPSRRRHQPHTDTPALPGHLAGHGVGVPQPVTPVSTADGDQSKLGNLEIWKQKREVQECKERDFAYLQLFAKKKLCERLSLKLLYFLPFSFGKQTSLKKTN